MGRGGGRIVVVMVVLFLVVPNRKVLGNDELLQYRHIRCTVIRCRRRRRQVLIHNSLIHLIILRRTCRTVKQ